MSTTNTDKDEISRLLENFAYTTRMGLQDQVLANHAEDLVIFDVLPPLKYESARDYRDSWDEWQPKTDGEGIFEFDSLAITAGDTVAFAFGLIRCGGTTPEGKVFEDKVRATFCLCKRHGKWLVTHQHVSMPVGGARG